MDWAVMIFAAGFGTRMRHLTKDRPKPMVEVSGAPLIDHAVALAQALPAAKTVVNLHYKPDVLLQHLAGQSVETILEVPNILDTGGGLRNALPVLERDTVMTLNSDAVWSGSNPLSLLAKAWEPDRMDALLMCIPKVTAIGHEGNGNFVLDVQGRAARGDGLIYGGAQIIKTELLKTIPEKAFSLNVIWDLMIAENRLYAMEYDGKWCDVGHPEGIALAEDILRARHV
ncbi:MAG: nucleotidyltransferase family protein [Roseobacter sp.]